MSIPTIAISGQLLPPDNVAVGGSVRFRLSGPDVDTGTGVVVPREHVVPLNAGAVAVNLWPTARGQNGRSYSVDISLAPASPDAPRGWVGLGQFTLPATPGSRNLGDLLRDFGIVLPMDTALVQALFAARDLAVASAGAVQSAAGAAALSATSAGNSSAAALVMVIAAGAKIFATTAAGIAAMPNGGIFMVPLSVSGGLDIRLRTSGSNSSSIGQILPPVQSQTDTTEGRIPITGWLGMGSSRAVYSADLNTATQGGLHSRWDSATLNVPSFFSGNQGAAFTFPGHAAGRELQIALENQGNNPLRVAIRQNRGGTWQPWRELWHRGITTVDGNGFLKEASPIIRLFADRIDEPVEDIGASFERLGVGEYLLRNVEPLALEGWQIQTPDDVNGNKLIALDGMPEYDADAREMIVRTYAIRWSGGMLCAGAPADIPAGSFVMLRFARAAEEETDQTET